MVTVWRLSWLFLSGRDEKKTAAQVDTEGRQYGQTYDHILALMIQTNLMMQKSEEAAVSEL